MLKGLESFKTILAEGDFRYFSSLYDRDEFIKDVKTVSNELKALEIIKNKEIDIKAFNDLSNLEEFNYYCSPELTQEEYDLIKEVLK